MTDTDERNQFFGHTLNNDILNNHKKYFNDLISFLNKKNPIYENENIIKKIYLKYK